LPSGNPPLEPDLPLQKLPSCFFTIAQTENALISNLLELPDSKRQAVGEFPTASFYNQEYWDIKSF
jgi:hypothetical protein